MVICLDQGADLHLAQLMPLPLTVFCFSEIQIGFTFLVPAHAGSPGKRQLNGCMYVCMSVSASVGAHTESSVPTPQIFQLNHYSKFFELADVTSELRGHSLKLFKPRCHTTVRQNFFSLRIVNEWNKLPQNVVEAPSINTFNNTLDRHWHDMGI